MPLQGFSIVAYIDPDPESVTAENGTNALLLTAERVVSSWAATRRQAERERERMHADYPNAVVQIE